ncbi:MAG: hypothetical protein J6P95_05725 [Paludibacteraceae bacterium]|nr:hypothetical protein [Paludibacteraceae bacterium]
MKRTNLLLFISVLFFVNIYAQEKGVLEEYRRNSIATMMVYHSEDTFGIHIYDAFQSIPIPDKYDDHSIGWNVIFNDSITGVERKSNGLIKAEYGKPLSKKDVEKNGKALEKVLNEAQCAKIMVAKWFGMNLVDSTCNVWDGFNMDLIQQRGQYNASDVDVSTALNTSRGLAILADAGEELLNNSFFLINDMTYVTAEQKATVAKAILNVLLRTSDPNSTGSQVADIAGKIADSFTGFTVKTHSYLFQLVWNDSIANTFYDKYYVENPRCTEDSAKIVAFLQDSSLFTLKYVAHEYEYDGKSVLKGKYSREELVKMVCTRSMDKNIAALQLAYEDFKVKTPIYEILTNEKGKIIGYTAKIGLKEGITEKSSFQVVQRILDPETNRTKYRYVATLVPVNGKIWDNRYNAVLEEAPGSELSATTFKKKSGGEILPGMLIIEGKYSKVESE